MFDLGALTPRFFEMKLRNGLFLEVEPPKLKVLKKIMETSKIKNGKMDDNAVNNLAVGLSLALSKNKQGKPITVEYIMDNMNIDEIQMLLTAYFNWVGEINNQKN